MKVRSVSSLNSQQNFKGTLFISPKAIAKGRACIIGNSGGVIPSSVIEEGLNFYTFYRVEDENRTIDHLQGREVPFLHFPNLQSAFGAGKKATDAIGEMFETLFTSGNKTIESLKSKIGNEQITEGMYAWAPDPSNAAGRTITPEFEVLT